MAVKVDRLLCFYCGGCASVCPVSILELRDVELAVTDQKKCIKCRSCEKTCPVGAIKVVE
jgi:NAD-dependent dihydropyrimidine dehydrogenase PreA subunit